MVVWGRKEHGKLRMSGQEENKSSDEIIRKPENHKDFPMLFFTMLLWVVYSVSWNHECQVQTIEASSATRAKSPGTCMTPAIRLSVHAQRILSCIIQAARNNLTGVYVKAICIVILGRHD
ncbi:hypothetical protein ElyMa_004924000 [Elysia marginata]|uniref:Uncharacterized protein n=1 Tax=Elysia marginata TaxID=1093978 RepID=A0AAV4IXI4_9GAST|nr:hypothetical protein ElyMa_004924000 [Elysia marginata]